MAGGDDGKVVKVETRKRGKRGILHLTRLYSNRYIFAAALTGPFHHDSELHIVDRSLLQLERCSKLPRHWVARLPSILLFLGGIG